VSWRDSSSETTDESSLDIPSVARIQPRARTHRRGPRHWFFWLIGGCFGVLLLLGALCGALGGLAVGVYQFVYHQPTATAETLRTFAVQGVPRLVVTNPAGSVRLAPGEEGAVRIEATRRARDHTEDDARTALATISLELRQDGEVISVGARFARYESVWPGASRSVDLLITVPIRTSTLVHLSTGDATVGALAGPLSIDVDAGNVHVTGAMITGDSQVQVGAGNVSIDGALADAAALAVTIDAGTASLTLPSTTAAHIEARTNAGDITVHGWPISPHGASGATLLAAGDTHPGALARLTVAVEAGDISIQAR
jgi:hypothetical protein